MLKKTQADKLGGGGHTHTHTHHNTRLSPVCSTNIASNGSRFSSPISDQEETLRCASMRRRLQGLMELFRAAGWSKEETETHQHSHTHSP